jgi:hypothetical protein
MSCRSGSPRSGAYRRPRAGWCRWCPDRRPTVGVLTSVGGARVCYEVDEADVVTGGILRPVPSGEAMPWALAVVKHDHDLVPILNLNMLRDRLAEAGNRS